MKRVVIVVVSGLFGLAAAHQVFAEEDQKASAPGAAEYIGISVNAPKVYEERALRAMLEQAEAQLAALRPIGGPKLDAAIGTLQGASQTTTAFSLTAQGLSQPSVTTKETQGRVDGELVTTAVEETTTAPQATPTPPTAPTAAALAGAGFGLSARDLLAEQTALSYQIAGLRLALERATSDRVNSVPNSQGELIQRDRYPVVLGFTIGVDRPRKRQVAEVEITLRLEGEEKSPAPPGIVSPPGISLVGVLPAKDAYNVAAITDSSTNIGVGQVVSAFQLGAGFFQSRKTYYIVRDVDTLSIAHGPDYENPNQIRVAWQFRPVLGRQIVEPGPRQVFVVLAIDDNRYDSDKFSISAQANTRWTPIGRKGVLKEKVNKVETGSRDLGKLGYWQIFTDQLLAPYAGNLQLTLLSERQGMVSVQGSSLSAESRILVGDKTIDRGTGLGFRDDTALSFLVPLIDLARASDVYLVNRYQQPVPLRRRDLAKVSLQARNCNPTRIPGTDRYRIEAILEGTPPVEVENLLAVAGDTVVAGEAGTDEVRDRDFPGLQTFKRLPCIGAECSPDGVKVSFEIPSESVRRNAQVTIREVFGGPRRTVRCDLPVLPAVDRIVTAGKAKDKIRLALQGQRLTLLQHALVAGEPIAFTEQTDALALLDLSSASIEGVEFLLVRVRPAPGTPAAGDIMIVPFKQKVEVKKPIFSTAPAIAQHFSGPIEIQGENLDSIKQVGFEGLELRKSIVGKKLTVHLVSKVTEQPALRSLTVTLVDGSEVELPLTVQPRT